MTPLLSGRAEEPSGAALSLSETWLTPWVPRQGDLFLDIGANVGQWTNVLAPRFRHVHAIEPGAEAVAILKKKAPANVVIHEFAAWSAEEEREFASFASSEHLSAYFENEGINTGPKRGTVTLPCRRLDTLCLEGKVDFIKCDVEGAEVRVFDGAERLIGEHRPRLLIEVHSRENLRLLVEWLARQRYRCQVVRHPAYPPFSAHWFDHCWIAADPVCAPG